MDSTITDLIDLKRYEDYLVTKMPKAATEGPKGLALLEQSIAYTVKSGGKRFRPALSLLTAKTLEADEDSVFAVGTAAEWIHTYSLIHDDLPCMDNDDERRGQPSNHKVYGEALALLAGDALLTETFGFLAREYSEVPDRAVKIISELSSLAGVNGMVGGQSVDIDEDSDEKAKWISYIHEKKTGALIQASVVCAAHACGADETKVAALRSFSDQLGLAFQLADDLLDWDPENPEPTSYVNVVGPEETARLLNETSDQCLNHLEKVGLQTKFFAPLVEFNKTRES